MQKSLAKVYLVGAGPGDIDLLTIRAYNTIKKADVILYDSLVNEDILQELATSAKKIFVGKRLGRHSLSQEKINNKLLECANKYRNVIRLKGGDPLIFGRGGEEATFLREHGIAFEVIPGITAAMAASATLEMPLTHRQFGQSVIFLSGYSRKSDSAGLPDYDWGFLATQSLTLVFYMGLHHAEQIAAKLMENDMPGQTPVAILSELSLPEEKIVITTVANLAGLLKREPMKFPALVVIGKVVSLANPLKDSLESDDIQNSIQSQSKSATNRPEPLAEPHLKKNSDILVNIFHGSKILVDSALPETFCSQLKQGLQVKRVEYCFLTSQFKPNYNELFKKLYLENKNYTIAIWPIFLLPGKHVDEDIPDVITELSQLYPEFGLSLLKAPDILDDMLPALIAAAVKRGLG